jgi:hypothetical protein
MSRFIIDISKILGTCAGFTSECLGLKVVPIILFYRNILYDAVYR